MPATVPLLAMLAALVLTPTVVAAREAVDLELVLAVDISGSIDAEEASQQRQGYIAAIADPQVVAAIRSTATGRVALAYVEWSGADSQQIVIPWTVVDGPEAAEAFAARLAETPMHRGMWTSISGAIDFAVPLFDQAGLDAGRRAIDVSGDGVNNRGRPVTLARDEAVARGIVINGLPIMNDRPNPYGSATPAEIGLDRYYAENVIGGPGSFSIPAPGFEAFKDAILRKLILEIAGGTPTPWSLAAARPFPLATPTRRRPAVAQAPKTETTPKPDQRPAERPDHPRDESLVDETIDDSFPASDPPAWTSETGSGKPAGPGEKGGRSGT